MLASSGKSSLMAMLKDSIDEVGKTRRVKTLWFNAWRYEGKEEIQPALIHAVLNKLEEDKSFLDDCKDVLGRLKKGASVLKLAKFIATFPPIEWPIKIGFSNCSS